MAPPSYTRATASSTMKGHPQSSKTKEAETPKGAPKKLKRPSTLTLANRKTIIYNADLHPINPHDTKKPCPLATLPSELRTIIYTYILAPSRGINQPQQKICAKTSASPPYIWPALLHICRAMRIEAAYTYYTSTPFTFCVRNLNFASSVMRWVDSLPREHRRLLARNRRIKIDIVPRFSNSFTYAPRNYLLDGFMDQHWAACAPFGNLYAVYGDEHREHFIVFCRLATWWLWCDKMGNGKIEWSYVFDEAGEQRQTFWMGYPREELLCFLVERVSVLVMGCVRRAWTRRNTRTVGMRREAVRMLDALERWNERDVEAAMEAAEVWNKWMRAVRRVVAKW